MTVEEIWSALGIEETQDRAAVRRAYAQRLKSTHPEDDPEGFKALREAYEIALAFAEGRLVRVSEPDEGSKSEEDPQAPRPEAATRDEDLDGDPAAAHFSACNALVEDLASGVPDDVLQAKLATLLNAPILENISIFERTGLGLAAALLQSAPHGACLVAPVVRHFGWKAAEDRWDTPRQVSDLLVYDQALAQRQELREDNAHAYAILTSPPPRMADDQTRRDHSAVTYLLYLARNQHTWLLAEFDSQCIAWWEAYTPKPARRKTPMTVRLAQVGGAVLAAFFVLIIISSWDVDIYAPPPSVAAPDWTSSAYIEDPEVSENAKHLADQCSLEARTEALSPVSCDEALKLRPGSTAVLLDRAYLNLKAGHAEAAILDYDNLVGRMPLNAFALFGRGLARARLLEKEAAREDLCGAIKISPAIRSQVEEAYRFQVVAGYVSCS